METATTLPKHGWTKLRGITKEEHCPKKQVNGISCITQIWPTVYKQEELESQFAVSHGGDKDKHKKDTANCFL